MTINKPEKIISEQQEICLISEKQQIIKQKTETIVKQEDKLMMSEEPKKDEDKTPSNVIIVGSNNIMGHNIFLVNTNTKDEDLSTLIESLPPETRDSFLKLFAMFIQNKS